MRHLIYFLAHYQYLSLIFIQKFLIFSELRPDLSGNPFFSMAKALEKKDWERKAEFGAIKILFINYFEVSFHIFIASSA